MIRGILLVFLDGVGIGVPEPERNPFFVAPLPTLDALLGGRRPSLEDPHLRHEGVREAAVLPLDARLGVEGLPQSGTGQTALLTGRNGPRIFGRHFGPWVPVSLRPLVEEESLLARALAAGHRTTFANAYPQGWPGPGGGRRVAGPPLAARGAGLLTRDHRHLQEGRAVSSDMVNDGWRRHLGFADLPDPSPRAAGETLASLAAEHDLTLYAHYATDTAGHRGGMQGAIEALVRVDEFLDGILRALPEDHLLLVASDHGNIEDVDRGHTLNPSMGMLVGPDALRRARRLSSILDLTPAILDWLDDR